MSIQAYPISRSRNSHIQPSLPRRENTERQWRNLGLKNQEIHSLASLSVNAEKVVIPVFALLALPSLYTSLTSVLNGSNNGQGIDSQYSSSGSNNFQQPQQIQSMGNSLLDLLSVFGEMSARPICSVGNLIRVGINGSMAFGNDEWKRVANMLYNFASAFIAIGWGVDGHPELSEGIKQEKTFLGKVTYQAKSFGRFWRDLPGKLVSKIKGEKPPGEVLPLKAKLSKYGYFVHAALALLSTGVLVISNLLPKGKSASEESIDGTQKGYIRNQVEELGWNIGKASRLPLLISIFADAFNPHNFSRYNWIGSLLSFTYGLSAVANMLWMDIPQVSATTDFMKNILSNLRSLWARNVHIQESKTP